MGEMSFMELPPQHNFGDPCLPMGLTVQCPPMVPSTARHSFTDHQIPPWSVNLSYRRSTLADSSPVSRPRTLRPSTPIDQDSMVYK